jgi:WD40 repeat protein
VLPEEPPHHVTICRTRRLIDIETDEAPAQLLMPRPPTTYICAHDVSPDGQFLLVDHPGAASSVYVLSLLDHTLQPIATTSAAEHAGAFAPDGHSIAYASNESGSEEVYVQPFPPSGTRWQVSLGGGRSPRWRHDGRELFYVDSAGQHGCARSWRTRGRRDGPDLHNYDRVHRCGGQYVDIQGNRHGAARFLHQR